MEGSNLPEELKPSIAVICIWEVGDGGVATGTWLASTSSSVGKGSITYGQERMETRAMPAMMADLTL
jgi:hypothetical protein